mgnify:FL=1
MISNIRNKKIVLISPHPDDVEIGMGGTAFLLAKKNKIHHLIATNGANSANIFKDKKKLVEARKKEAINSNKYMGIENIKFFEYDEVKSKSIKLKFEVKTKEYLERINPDFIFLPHPSFDNHPTHRIVSKTVINNLQMLENKPKIICYEVWGAFRKYNHFVDISKIIKIKKKIISFHKSQLKVKDYINGILGINKYHAVFNDFIKDNAKYIEVFLEYEAT